jgi:hypothetical protein
MHQPALRRSTTASIGGRDGRRRVALTILRDLVTLDALIFLVAALLHLGGRLSVGPLLLVLGRIIPATVVEGVIGILFLVTAYGLVTRATWARGVAVGAHLFALAGVLLDLAAVTAESGPYESLNVGYHVGMLAAVVAGLLLQFWAGDRAAVQQARSGRDVEGIHA